MKLSKILSIATIFAVAVSANAAERLTLKAAKSSSSYYQMAVQVGENVSKLTNKELSINFVPHLINATRGMLVSVYATLKDDSIDVNTILENKYKNSKFVRIKNKPVDIKSTAGTNFCDIFVAKNKKAIFINSSIDNLLRGASSQAVCNANIMCGYEENEGIPIIAYVP